MPRSISKYGRPLPWFMRYASDYYARQTLSKSPSNMNRLCWNLERWQKTLKWKRKKRGFDWRIMTDESVPVDQDSWGKVEDIYKRFCADVKQLSAKFAAGRYDSDMMKEEYGRCYESYRAECRSACPDRKKLANIVVRLGYETHPSWNKKFMWIMAGGGIVDNIKQVEVKLPVLDPYGDIEYLGRTYSVIGLEPGSDVLKEAFE